MTDETPPEGEDQGPGTAAEGGTIYHAEIDPKYQDLALENFWSVLKGNGIKRENIRIAKFEGETLEFLAVTLLKLKTKISDKRQAGKVTTMPVIGSEEQLRTAVTKEEHKITHSQDVIKRIKDVILRRDDKGFGLENEFIKMPFLHRDWVIHEPCNACGTKGKINCPNCHGKGSITCPSCHGQGNETCPNCGGRQYMPGPNNQQQQCMHCSGTGRIGCRTCNQGHTVACPKCKGSAIITCMQCNGHAWNSHIFMVEIDCFANFEYDKERLPEKIVRYIESFGPNLPHHVEFKPVIMGREHEQDVIALPYQIRTPHADVIFEINEDMKIGAFMFGTQGLLFDMPYFLETIMAPGIKQLETAGAGKGDIAALLIKAGRYKTLRQIILASSKLSKPKAYQAIMHRTPIGLSKDMAKNLITAADTALNNITRRPRQTGIALGGMLAGAAYGGYFYGLRSALLETLPRIPALHNLLDGCVCLIGMALSILAIKGMAGYTIHKTLASLTKNSNQKMALAKAGDQANWALVLSAIVFLVIAFSTLETSAVSPGWVLQLQKLLGL